MVELPRLATHVGSRKHDAMVQARPEELVTGVTGYNSPAPSPALTTLEHMEPTMSQLMMPGMTYPSRDFIF